MSTETFRTNRYKLEIELGDTVGRILLADIYNGIAFADSEYRYSAFVEYEGRIIELDGLHAPVIERGEERGGQMVTISGRLGAAHAGPSVNLQHRIFMPEGEDYLEDQIIMQNLGESDVVLRGYRFGFRKKLEKPEAYGGPGIDIEDYRLIALPFRLQPDGKKHDYQLDDIYNGRYQYSEFYNPMRVTQDLVDRGRGRSEGWAWSDGENGLLVVKYNPRMIEYSMIETERYAGGVYLNFGGASPSLYNEPFEVRTLGPRKQIAFGHTRYHFYEGLWRRGAYMFREYMSRLGHSMPDNYNPPIVWSSQFDICSRDASDLAKNYNFNALTSQAAKAEEIGAEAIYLDAGWEMCEGGTVWDAERLGDITDFVRRVKNDNNLAVGIRVSGRSYCDDFPGMYRRTFDSLTGYYATYSQKPFYEPCVSYPKYQDEKLQRIMMLVDAGVSMIGLDEFDWRGPCVDPNHNHLVPTTPSAHARAVASMTRELRNRKPGILTEMHDPVWPWGVRYLPAYYLHDTGNSFDEIRAFEFGSEPLDSLISGRALSLFYYNLAYDIPLHLQINMQKDNENCLAFWWYASTVRHLGIGGSKGKTDRFALYKNAMAEYKPLKELYTSGTFYGLDELTHIHVLTESGRAVVNAFNLTDKPVSRLVEINPSELGLMEEFKVEGAPSDMSRGKLILKLQIPPMSPLIVRLVPK